jgi:peptidoglycan/xylan/chitin deacetylase (PgdA/CDA1 family)
MSMPWILGGFISNNLGWWQEQLEFLRADGFHRPVGAAAVHSPLRSRVATSGEKVLALTFDDGPSEYTEGVLKVLESYGLPGTFFVVGNRAESMPDAVRRIAEAGHAIGIHGWSHRSLPELDDTSLIEEIERTGALLQQITGTPCRHVRPPMGDYDARVVSCLAERDLVTWLWTTDAKDWASSASDQQVARDTLNALTPGGVILLHDGGGDRSHTVRALPAIIEGALARNFRFVSLEYAFS